MDARDEAFDEAALVAGRGSGGGRRLLGPRDERAFRLRRAFELRDRPRHHVRIALEALEHIFEREQRRELFERTGRLIELHERVVRALEERLLLRNAARTKQKMQLWNVLALALLATVQECNGPAHTQSLGLL